MLKEAILEISGCYRLFQWANGAGKMRRILSSECICAHEGDRILDIACGTADIRPYLPANARYTGIDNNLDYIAHDRKAFSGDSNTEFICEDLNEYVAHTDQRYDCILLMGVLHHLTDEQVRSCLSTLPTLLAPGGRILTMDGVYTDDLNAFERALLANDRGHYVRQFPDWLALVTGCLRGASHTIRKDLYYLPYQQILFSYQAET